MNDDAIHPESDSVPPNSSYSSGFRRLRTWRSTELIVVVKNSRLHAIHRRLFRATGCKNLPFTRDLRIPAKGSISRSFREKGAERPAISRRV